MRNNGLGLVRLFGYLLLDGCLKRTWSTWKDTKPCLGGIKRLGRRMIPQFDSARDGKRKRVVMEF